MNVRQFTTSVATALRPIYPEPEAKAIAALVVEHLLQMDAMERMMEAQQPVSEDAEAALIPLLARLLAHEPVPTSSTDSPVWPACSCLIR